MHSFPTRLAALYASVSVIWIAGSDHAVNQIFFDPNTQAMVQTFKDWGFVLVTTALLYVLLRKELDRKSATERRLSESEVRYRDLYDSMPIGFAEHDPVFDAEGRVSHPGRPNYPQLLSWPGPLCYGER